MISDPIKEGLARGWKAIDAATLERDLDLDADVVVIGSGAGGGVTAGGPRECRPQGRDRRGRPA